MTIRAQRNSAHTWRSPIASQSVPAGGASDGIGGSFLENVELARSRRREEADFSGNRHSVSTSLSRRLLPERAAGLSFSPIFHTADARERTADRFAGICPKHGGGTRNGLGASAFGQKERQLPERPPTYNFCPPPNHFAGWRNQFGVPQIHFAASQNHSAVLQNHFASPQTHFAGPQNRFIASQIHFAGHPVSSCL